MTMNETLTMTALMLAPAFFSLLGMAAFGSPVVAFLGEVVAKSKGRVFYDKYGQQTAAMGLILLILLIIVEIAGIAIVYTKFPQLFQKFATPDSPLICALYALGAFIVFGVPYFLTWKKMRQSKGAHMTLGFLATVSAIALVAIAVTAKLIIGLPPELAQSQIALGVKSMIAPMAVMYVILTMASAAGLSCTYLVLRRNKDDFGRDYYNFSLKLAARWAAIPMVLFLVCQGWLFAVLPETFKTMVMGTPLGIVWAVGAGFGLISVIIWALIARSQTPLQMKGLTFLTAALLWLMHTANATLFMNFMSMF